MTAGIAREYSRATQAREAEVTLAAQGRESEHASAFAATAKLFKASVHDLLADPSLADEIFGPDTLLVQCKTSKDLVHVAAALDGHLTATILGDEEDLEANRELIQILEQKAGRLIFNGYPTGVEVSHAMVHGGPYPSTSDPRFTSVGSLAIYRFARPGLLSGFSASRCFHRSCRTQIRWALRDFATANLKAHKQDANRSCCESRVGNGMIPLFEHEQRGGLRDSFHTFP